MTREEREEAIKIISQMVKDEEGFLSDNTVKAHKMAIQALSQEPTDKPMCDRNICISNEYNGIGCNECIVNKAEQEPRMTLDEAIKHAEEVAEENEKFCYKKGGEGGYFNEDTDWNNTKCAEEHRQLAEWLKDYKRLLEQEPTEKPMTVDEMEREYEKSKALFHKIVECDDAISRDAVCNIVNDIRDCISVEGYCAIIERLKKLPSVNPVPMLSIQITEREKYGRFN